MTWTPATGTFDPVKDYEDRIHDDLFRLLGQPAGDRDDLVYELAQTPAIRHLLDEYRQLIGICDRTYPYLHSTDRERYDRIRWGTVRECCGHPFGGADGHDYDCKTREDQ